MKHKKRRKALPLVAICLSLAGIAAYVFLGSYRDLQFYNNKIDDLKSQIAEQQKISKQLDEKEKLYTSEDYIEKVARETLGLVKSDEKVFKNYNDKQ